MSVPTPGLLVVELRAEQTHALRRAVLRAGTPTTEVRFAEDDWPGVTHLGVMDGDELIATSTWLPLGYAAEPLTPAAQLRGMATSTSRQGHGVGTLLIEAGVARCAAAGVELVWARARDAALRFYQRNGFAVVGDGYIDEATQLPHHTVVRRIASAGSV